MFGWFKRKPRVPLKLEDAVKCSNLVELERWLNRHIIYRPDRAGEEWKPVEQTLKDRRGDCEDGALLVSEVMKEWGIEHHLMCGWPVKGQGHAYVLLAPHDTWIHYTFDHGGHWFLRTKRTNMMPYGKLAKLLYPKHVAWREHDVE